MTNTCWRLINMCWRRRSSLLLAAAGLAAVFNAQLYAHAGAPDPFEPQTPPASDRRLEFVTNEGTWMALDVSPDGRTIMFDLLGDIYALDIDGGAARPVLTGVAFETHPVFSPDGERFAFISDRSGSSNLWIADADGSNPKQLSYDEGATLFSSPAWSADGQTVYVSRAVHSVLAFELFGFDRDTGERERVTNAKPSGDESFDDRHNAMGAAASPDGRYLYYATKTGSTWSDEDPPNWSIARKDLRSGDEDIIVSAAGGGGMKPALSRDGRLLVYASRHESQTGLRMRDLATGDDRWIAFPVDHDGQTGGYYSDMFPRYAFTPDGSQLIFSQQGKFRSLSLADGDQRGIPFSAHVDLALGPATRVEQPPETGPVRVRVIEETKLSPDGRSIVFSALGAIYVQELRDGARERRLIGHNLNAYQPSWSPDGASIVFVTWSAEDAGHIWSVPASGGEPRRLTSKPGFYSEPVFSPDGRILAAMRSNHYERLRAPTEISPARPVDVIRLPASGGDTALIAHAFGARLPQFSPDGSRLRFYTPDGLQSVSLAGAKLRTRARIVAQNPNQYFAEYSVPGEDVRLNPHGDRALVKAASQLYLLRLPPQRGEETPVLDLREPATGAAKLTEIGADFFGWSADGQTIYWSVGSTVRTIPASEALSLPRGEAEQKANEFSVTVELPRDVPQGALLLRGATAITMNGKDEVIKNADILIVNNRIAEIGKRGSVKAPEGAAIRNVKGKFIVPGFVDTHAHWFEIRRKLHDQGHWGFLANLAYGVTSGLDVQPFTIDVFAYQDMIDAGLMIGPRAYSTGPGVFVNSRIDSTQEARNVLTRYRDYYRTRNIKSYMVGGRQQRRYMIEAAAELGMAPTTEGASDLWLNLTHAIDGFAGVEHNLPVTPLHDDVIQFYAKTRVAYTPTLTVLYGGFPAWDDMMIRHHGEIDEKLKRFVPPSFLNDKLRNLRWRPAEYQTYGQFARDAIEIQRAGGLVGMGSHGTLQGLGYHWELEAYASGGATPYEVLKAATIGSSEVIGRAAEIGSLETGKYADLLVLDENPLNDIRNTRSLYFVMKNGRLYDADTLDEVWPSEKPASAPWFRNDAPHNVLK